MTITAYTGLSERLLITPDYEADTLVEVEADLSSYIDKYIKITDQGGKIYHVYEERDVPVIELAYDAPAYSIGFDSPTLIFIQDSAPVVPSGIKYLWIETNIGGNPSEFSFWFDGLS